MQKNPDVACPPVCLRSVTYEAILIVELSKSRCHVEFNIDNVSDDVSEKKQVSALSVVLLITPLRLPFDHDGVRV